MRNWIKKYKWDIVLFYIITIIFLNFAYFCNEHYAAHIYDCGREAYLPQLLLEGKVLYKDIFAMYNPLSYQFNALLYQIFGTNINTLFIAGTINALLCLLATYLISRQLTSKIPSTIITLTIFCICIANPVSVLEYIFPYSYGMIYSISSFLFFTLFTIYYMKFKKTYFAYIASILLGISLANRFEFALTYIPFIIFFAIKEKNLKSTMINILLFITPIILSYGILFLQGFTCNDLIEYVKFLHKFFNTPEQQEFMKKGTSIYNVFYHWHIILVCTIITIITLAINISILKFILRKETHIRNILIVLYISILSGLIFIIISQQINIKYVMILLNYPYHFFCSLSFLLFFILNDSVSKKKELIIILSLIAILASLRIGFVFISPYSVYYLILPLTVVFTYFIEKKYANNSKTTINALLIFFSLFIINNLALKFFINIYKPESTPVISKKGNINLGQENNKIYNNVLQWIETNTNKNDRILVLPENPLLNFLSDRPTNNKYYHLIPNHIAALDEDKIVVDLNTDKPEYIILQKIDYKGYGKQYLGIDYGFKIEDFIIKNYKEEANFKSKSEYSLIIYSRK